MNSKKQSQGAITARFKNVEKLNQSVSRPYLQKNEVGPRLSPESDIIHAKEVKYVDLYENKKIHFAYLVVLMVFGVGAFTYHDQNRKTQIRTETRIVYKEAPAARSVSATAEPAHFSGTEYKSNIYDRRAAELKIDGEISRLLDEESERYLREIRAHRDLHRDKSYFSSESREIELKNKKNTIRIRAERDRKLCEQFNDTFYCANWENFQKNRESF